MTKLRESNDYEGTFITIEGIDGAGKSTIARNITIPSKHAVWTQEPSDFWTGRTTRRAIEDDHTPELTDLFQFMSDRVFHNENLIIPTLEDGGTVVCDRYIDSTLTYQAESLKGVVDEPRTFLMELINDSKVVIPDLTILIDVSAETSITRSGQGDKYEEEEFISQVQRNYHELHSGTDRMVMVNGEQSKEDLISDVQEVVDAQF